MPLIQPDELTKDDHIQLWLLRNRGICARIARKVSVKRQAVYDILRGRNGWKSKDLRIEKLLAKAGAPYMDERLKVLLERERAQRRIA